MTRASTLRVYWGIGSAVSLSGDERTRVPSPLAGKPVRFASEQPQCTGIRRAKTSGMEKINLIGPITGRAGAHSPMRA